MQNLNNLISIIAPCAITVVAIIGGLIGSKIISISSDKDKLKEKVLTKSNELEIVNKQIDDLFLEIYNENSDDFIREFFDQINEGSKLIDFINVNKLDEQEVPVFEEKLENTIKYKKNDISELSTGFIELMVECEDQKTYTIVARTGPNLSQNQIIQRNNVILELGRKAELLDIEVKELKNILIKEISAKDLRNLFILMGFYLISDVFYPLFVIDFALDYETFLCNKFGLIASFIVFTIWIFVYLYYMLKKNASSGE